MANWEIGRNEKLGAELFRAVYEQDALGMVLRAVGPRDSRWLDVNDKFCQIFGYTRDELLELTSVDISYPEEQDDAVEYNERLLAGDLKSYSREKRYVHKDGHVIWANVWLSAVYGSNDKPSLIISVIEDITERKRDEAALLESENRFRALVDALPSAILMKDVDGTYLHANNRWFEWFNPERASITGKTVRDFYPDDHAAGIIAQEDEVLSTGQSIEYEYETPFSDGNVRSTLLQKFPVTDADGEIIGIGGINTDITERKRAEAEIMASKEQAEIANRAKSKFLAHMSHELRTPLNAIVGFSEALMTQTFGPLGDEKNIEFVNAIHEAGTHLTQIIGDILDLSRIEADHMPIDETVIDVSAVVERSLSMMAAKVAEKELHVHSDIHGAAAKIRADERHVTQVLLNLLSNAVKFTSSGGRIDVRVNAVNDDGLTLCVSDNGIGIDPRYLDKVMEPFVQAGTYSSPEYGGTGLGLAICRSLMELHGGTLTIESELGAGTTVTVAFPPERVIG
ncbi:MAG: PAS domain S-box protein [Rhodospirillales bacterium]